MALRVIGDVDQQAAEGRGELLASDDAGLAEVCVGKSQDAGGTFLKRFGQFLEELWASCAGIEFRFHLLNLLRSELTGFSVSEQTIEAARDVAKMKGDRCDAKRAGVELLVGERLDPTREVFLCEIEGVKNRARNSRDIRAGAAQPGFGAGAGFGVRHRNSLVARSSITQSKEEANCAEGSWYKVDAS